MNEKNNRTMDFEKGQVVYINYEDRIVTAKFAGFNLFEDDRPGMYVKNVKFPEGLSIPVIVDVARVDKDGDPVYWVLSSKCYGHLKEFVGDILVKMKAREVDAWRRLWESQEQRRMVENMVCEAGIDLHDLLPVNHPSHDDHRNRVDSMMKIRQQFPQNWENNDGKSYYPEQQISPEHGTELMRGISAKMLDDKSFRDLLNEAIEEENTRDDI